MVKVKAKNRNVAKICAGTQMPTRKIYTFDGVIDALGGLKAVAALMNVSPGTVYQWRRTGAKFPARSLDRIAAELERIGAHAPRHLWFFDPPCEHDDDKRADKRA
jgi:hypothetical protein